MLGGGGRGGASTEAAEQFLPTPKVERQVERGDDPSNFYRGHSMPTRNDFLVGLKNSAAFPRVVAPRGEKLSGNLAVVVPNDFPNECKLAFCDLVLKGGDTVKKEPNCFVRDVFIFHS